jgi:3-hydroxybutyryl-CoA dehydrogenase
MQFQHVGVVGAGTMGSGIAQVFAQFGAQVTLVDSSQAALDRGLATIDKSLAWFVDKQKMTSADAATTRGRISTSTALSALSECLLVVEAVFENQEVKCGVLRELDGLLAPDAILATNTSSISITVLAAATKRPGRVIGMHFMNPVPRMELIEVIRGAATEREVVDTIVELSKALGKVPAESEDYPGFIANRILMPMINEAIYALMEGVGTKEAIDTVMKLGMNHPMGPLTLADFIGLDICLNIMEVLHDGLGDPKYRPCPLLRRMVAAGHLGKKSGRGFYDYAPRRS